ncbi:PAS domain S-box protein [Thermodesulfobacteriota bacterium]
MDSKKLYQAITAAADNPSAPLLSPKEYGEYAELVSLINGLIAEKHRFEKEHQESINYIRSKIDQLLVTIGTAPLKPEELDDKTLLELDPIGVVADSFAQILEHLRDTNDSLNRTRKELEAVFESVGAGIIVVDTDMRLLAYNNGFRKIFLEGKDDVDPRGRYCRDIVCQEEMPPETCVFQKMIATGHSAMNFEWSYKDRYLSVLASPIRGEDNSISSGVILYQDITEQLQDKTELIEEKERLAITLRSIAEGVIALNMDNHITLMNEVAEKLTGYSQEEALGQQAEKIFWVVDQAIRNKALDLTGDLLNQHQSIGATVEGVLISREGEERLINASTGAIRDLKGSVTGAVIVFRDITEVKNLEKEIANARRLESMGILAGGIAHDFNNLLTGILGNISLAQITGDMDSRIAERLFKAEKACIRAKDLTQQLLTFAKGGSPVRKVMSIAELLRETSQFALRGTHINCRFDIVEDLWLTNVDEGQIGQVIHNLMLNAYQAMPEGGTITVLAENVTLESNNPYSLPMGRYINISVIDSGLGIPGEFLDKIFDPYFTTKQLGSGLGLASSYAIVKKHGGFISVQSMLGKGSTFSMLLPASDTELRPAEKQKKDTDTVLKLNAEKILVMDDDETILDFVASIFKHLGQEVTLVRDGREAVDLYRQALDGGEPFEVVILDLTVPGGMGGREALEELLRIDPAIKAIVSSGYSTDDAMATYREVGFMSAIPKPYRAQVLVQEINRVMQIKRPAMKKHF